MNQLRTARIGFCQMLDPYHATARVAISATLHRMAVANFSFLIKVTLSG